MALQTGPHAATSMPHVPPRTHVLVALVLAVLTGFAFLAVGYRWLTLGALVPVLLVLAGIQIVFQTAYYMRLRFSRRVFAMFFASGALLAVLIVIMVKTLVPL
jgi:heme/copper-type cytochrome/quinol oxidase subunit 4